MRLRTLLFILLSFLLFHAPEETFSQSVRLQVSPARGKREIAVGDLFYITMQISDMNETPDKPSNVPGAKVVYFDKTGQSSSMTTINGRMTQSFSFTYTITLRAQTEGKFTFGPVTIGGKKSNEVSYAIGAPMPAQNNPQDNSVSGRNVDPDKPTFIGKGDGNLFLRAEVSQSSAYVQQAIVYTVKLYSTYEAIKFIGATASPKFDGFVVEESKDISTSLEYETYNGKTYATAVIARYIIFPQLEGSLKVSGNTYTVSVDEREYYHDPWYGNLSIAKPLQLNVTPNDLTVVVKPLPKPVPADFCGGVGNFTISSTLPAQDFKTNQAASVIYKVAGTGNLKYITLPDLKNIFPPELEVYTPTSTANVKVGKTDVSGDMTYDYSFMPLESGVFRLPEIKLVYFNPNSGQYETSLAAGYTIEVDKGTGSEKSQTKTSATFDDELMPVVSKLSFSHRPYVYGFLYWLLYIIPLTILIGSYIFYRSYINANADALAVKSRRANRMARRRLKKAAVYMNSGQRNEFLDEIITSIWGYLSDKLSIPTSELSRDNLYGKLAMKEIPDTETDNLIKLIDEVEFEKYAPSDGQSSMQQIYAKTVETMNALEEYFKKSKGYE